MFDDDEFLGQLIGGSLLGGMTPSLAWKQPAPSYRTMDFKYGIDDQRPVAPETLDFRFGVHDQTPPSQRYQYLNRPGTIRSRQDLPIRSRQDLPIRSRADLAGTPSPLGLLDQLLGGSTVQPTLDAFYLRQLLGGMAQQPTRY